MLNNIIKVLPTIFGYANVVTTIRIVRTMAKFNQPRLSPVSKTGCTRIPTPIFRTTATRMTNIRIPILQVGHFFKDRRIRGMCFWRIFFNTLNSRDCVVVILSRTFTPLSIARSIYVIGSTWRETRDAIMKTFQSNHRKLFLFEKNEFLFEVFCGHVYEKKKTFCMNWAL